MDVTFANLINIIMVVYQDDLTAYSKKAEDHVQHLEKVFIKDLEYGISLNPKKCHFVVTEGKILGHIVLKEGIKIDPERAEAIDKIPIPKTVKAIQSFFGQINFVRRFVSNFAEIIKPISKMLKKGHKIDWTAEALDAFMSIKKAIKEAPILKSPNFTQPFQIFSFASMHNIAAIMLQKNVDGYGKTSICIGKSCKRIQTISCRSQSDCLCPSCCCQGHFDTI